MLWNVLETCSKKIELRFWCRSHQSHQIPPPPKYSCFLLHPSEGEKFGIRRNHSLCFLHKALLFLQKKLEKASPKINATEFNWAGWTINSYWLIHTLHCYTCHESNTCLCFFHSLIMIYVSLCLSLSLPPNPTDSKRRGTLNMREATGHPTSPCENFKWGLSEHFRNYDETLQLEETSPVLLQTGN